MRNPWATGLIFIFVALNEQLKNKLISNFLIQIQTKKQLLKKVYAFIPIVIGMFSIVTANAQIVYTDIIPDQTDTGIATLTYPLDINNDGTIDFNIVYHKEATGCTCPAYGHSWYIKITPLNSNEVADSVIDLTKSLDSNQLINAGAYLWNSNAGQLMKQLNYICIPRTGGCAAPGATNDSNGLWRSFDADKYLGLRFYSGGNPYYGWARLSVSSTGGFTIKDYAYKSVPNQFILAGQTTTTGIIENSFASSINLFPNPTTNQLTITLGTNNRKVEVTIADITGKVIYKTIATDTQKVEVDTKDFEEGIYLVQIQAVDFIETKKLIVVK